MITILKKDDIIELYDFVASQLESTPRIGNVISSLRADSSFKSITSFYDITHLRTAIKFIKRFNSNPKFSDESLKDIFSLMMLPRKTFKIMEKIETAIIEANVPFAAVSVVSNLNTGLGNTSKQFIMLDMLIARPSMFTIDEVKELSVLSVERLKAVKAAVNIGFSKDTVMGIANAKADDKQLSKISSYFVSSTDESIVKRLISDDYTPNQLNILVSVMNSSDENLKKNYDIIFNSDTSPEVMSTLLKIIDIYKNNNQKMEEVIEKIINADPNKAKGIFHCIVYGLDEDTIDLYAKNSIDSDTLDQLLFAKSNGISDKIIKRLMERKDLESRKRLRLASEGIAQNSMTLKKSIALSPLKATKKNSAITQRR